MISALPATHRTAFLSTPSLFYSISADERVRARHALLDIDTRFSSDSAVVHFDYTAPMAAIPLALHDAFDCVVIDPPFIDDDVWQRYAAASRVLLREGSDMRVLCTTIPENEALLQTLFPRIRRVAFQPSIPHLVYQYAAFCSWHAPGLEARNLEIAD